MLTRERIAARVQVALHNATPAGPRVFRSRRVALEASELPAIVIEIGDVSVQGLGSFTDQHTLELSLVVIARGDPFDSITAAVEEAAHRALLADPELALLVADVRAIGTSPEAEEADRTQGSMTLRYRITYLTRAADHGLAP